jgi:antitoxin component of RelBE/YafQ-DinJ toxin-antitoxin module
MPQITARMSTELRARFDRYADEVGLDASELARLLIVRAIGRRKLLRVSKDQDRRELGSNIRKLTAHFHHSEIVEEFDSFAAASGLIRAAAAKIVFERELDERWLAHALVWAPRRPRSI